tara:strand:+ start:4980 stop:6050 length:1071 start_codon:yes stop_codon:yes gene_type:complete
MAKTKTTTEDVPFAQPYMEQMLSEAQRLYENRGGIKPYSGMTLTPMSANRDLALSMIAQQAKSGNPWLDSMNTQLRDTMEGEYLSPESNPYLRQAYEQAARGVGETFRDYTMPNLQSEFASAGRMGSGALADRTQRNEEAFGRTLNELATGIYAPAYESERDRQLKAMQYAPAAAEMQYLDPRMLALSGQEREQYRQAQLNEQMRKYYERQGQPYDALAAYGNMVTGGNYGGSQTMTASSKPGISDWIGLGLGGLNWMNQQGASGQTAGGQLGTTLSNIWNYTGICHVARTVFGQDNPEWVAFYFWKEEQAPKWFRKLYDRYAKPVAQWIKDKPRIQSIIRKWMRSRINKKENRDG